MEDKRIRRELEKTREQLEMYRLIFESIYNGSMVTDAKGFITHFNKPYGHFLGVKIRPQRGRLWINP